MKIPFVDLKRQYLSIKEEIDRCISDVLLSSSFIGGVQVKTFEHNFAGYLGVKHCIGVANGTDALFIAMKALGIGKGDEVITVANSFFATSEAISMTGADVVYVDCDKDYYTIDVSLIEKKITKKTKAIIPVHLYGQPAEMDMIRDIAARNGLHVIGDAAQAHGARYRNQNVGTLGDAVCFSFFPGKNLGAYGDAGAIVTNDDDLARQARMFANHGRIDKYNHEFEGMNSRLDGIQAAILTVKLKYLDEWTARRRAIANRYTKELADVVTVPKVQQDVFHVYHLFVIRLQNRETVVQYLADKGVSTGIHYPIPLPFLKAYVQVGYGREDFPAAYENSNQILSLPIHGSMQDDEVDFVIETLKTATSVK